MNHQYRRSKSCSGTARGRKLFLWRFHTHSSRPQRSTPLPLQCQLAPCCAQHWMPHTAAKWPRFRALHIISFLRPATVHYRTFCNTANPIISHPPTPPIRLMSDCGPLQLHQLGLRGQLLLMATGGSSPWISIPRIDAESKNSLKHPQAGVRRTRAVHEMSVCAVWRKKHWRCWIVCRPSYHAQFYHWYRKVWRLPCAVPNLPGLYDFGRRWYLHQRDNGWSTKWERWVEWICSNKIVVQLLLAQVTLLSRPKLLGQTANCTLSLSMLLRGWCLFLFLHPVRNGHLQQVLQSRYDSSLSCKAITQVRNCRTSDLAEVDEELVGSFGNPPETCLSVGTIIPTIWN